MRDAEGRTYRVNLTGRGLVEFEPAVASIDASALIQAAREHTAERKRRHSEAGRLRERAKITWHFAEGAGRLVHRFRNSGSDPTT